MVDSTVIIGSLNDKELKESINALVNHVEQSTQKMAKSFDATIDNMKKKLQELGIAKVDMGGGTDGGSTRRTSAVQKETQARKELVTTLDQQAKAEKEAYTPSKAEESYYAIVKKMRENVALLAMEIKNMPSWSLDRQFTAYMQYERQIEQVRQKIAELRQQLNELGKDPNPNRLVIKQTMEEIQAQQQKIVSLEREQVQVTNQIAATDKQVLAQKQEQYDKEKQALIEMSAGRREITTFTRQQAQAQQEVVNGVQMQIKSTNDAADAERRLRDNVKAYAAEVRDAFKYNPNSKWTTLSGTWAGIGTNNAVVYRENDERAKGLTIEQQILNLLNQEEQAYTAMINRSGAQLEKEREITQELEKRKSYKSPYVGINENFNKMVGKTIGASAGEIESTSTKISKMSVYLKQLQQSYESLTITERNSPFGKQLREQIQQTSRELKAFRAEMSRPVSLQSALAAPARTLDEISQKIRQLNAYKMGINLMNPNAAAEINKVDAAIRKLQTEMDKYMAKGRQINEINNALGRSWNYMKNRLAFYFTVGASTQFVKQLIDIRGQYELLERSIGILIDSAQNGSQIFAELNAMAIKSPFTTMELGAAAKQLVAYDVAAKDVVETTRRLADMAAAVGIPIERLTYALGQVKAYGYLNARDARMFANAGIPLVKELADRYTELEGRLVSTSDVYDRIKKKAISYEDVMETVNKMTDEGGKFFNFQEKAADTLKVRIANLTLAWNNMLNEMGKDNQGILSGALVETKKIFENWRNINNMLLSVISVFGLMKAAQLTILLLTSKTLTATRAFVILQTVLGKKIAVNLAAMGKGFMKFVSSPMNLAAAAVAAFGVALGKAIADYSDLKAANQNFNKSIADAANENINSIDKFFSEYKEHFAELGSANKSDQQKLWERIQEEIEKTTKNAEQFIHTLNSIPDAVDKINFGKKVLTQAQEIEKEAKRLADLDVFNIGGGFADDSLAKNLQQTTKIINELIKKYGSLRDAEQKIGTATYTGDWNNYLQSVKETERELENFTAQLDKANIGKIMGDDPSMQLANIREFANIIRDNFLATEEGQKITAEGQARLNDSLDKWIAKQAVANNVIKDANVAAIESNRTAWETFFNQLSRSDKERLDYLVETNQTGSDDFRELWDKATNEMAENATTSYNLIQDQIAKLRDTPDIVINVVYKQIMGEEEELDPQRKAYKDKYLKPQGEYIKSQEEYFKERDKLTRKYGRFIKKEGEDNVEWEKRLGEEYQANKKSLASLTAQIKKSANMSEVDKKAKLEEIQALKDGNEVLEELRKNQGFDYDQFEKGKNKGKGGKKKDLVLEALKQEISLVEKLQGDYDKLAKSGASQADALATIRGAYGKTIDLLNTKLKGFGLQTLDLSIITGKDPNKALKHFQDTLDSLVSKGLLNLERSKEVEAVIEKFTLSAKTYNLDKITKGLNNELGKLKEEYELAVELDANPELGDMFVEMMGLDKNQIDQIPRTYYDVAKKAQASIDKVLKDNNVLSAFNLEDNLQKDSLKKWAEANGHELKDGLMTELSKYVEWVNKVRLDESKKQIKAWQELLKKYSEFEYKRKQVAETAMKERVDLVNKLGSQSQKSYVAKIMTKLDATDNPSEKERLKGELESIISDLTESNEQAARIAVSISRKESEETAKINFEEFKNGDDWIAAMGDSANLTSETIRRLIKELQDLIATNSDLDATQIKEINGSIEKMRNTLIERNPFSALSGSIDTVKQKTQELKKARKELEGAEISEQLAKISGNFYKLGKAQENVRKKINKVKQKERELSDAQSDLGKNISDAINQVREFYNIMTNLQSALGETANQAIQAGLGMAIAMNTAFEAIKNGERSVAILAIIEAALTAINFVAGLFGGKKDTFTPLKEQLETLTDVMGKVAQAQLEALGKMTGSRAVKKYMELKKNNDLIVQSYRDLAYAAGESGSSAGSHSYAYRTNRDLANSWEKISQLAGTTVTKIQDLYNLTPEQLKAIMEGAPVEWAKMSSEIREALEGIIEYGIDKTKEYTEALAEALTNITLDDLTNDFENMLQDMDSSAETFAEDFEEYMRNAIIRSMMVGTYANELETWYKHFQERIKDDELSESDVERLREEYMDIVNRALAERDRLLDVVGSSVQDGDLSALQQGIQGITEDTASALEAYMNSVSQQVYYHSSLLEQIRDAVSAYDADIQLATQAEMLLQLQQSYQVQMSIQGILEGVLTPSGQAFQVELL